MRESFARQGLMQTLSAEMTLVAPGATEIRFPYAAALSQQNGYLHAGAVTAALDSGCGYAAYTLAPEGYEVLSVEFKVNLLAPAVGEWFVARAQVKRAGKTLAVCSADAFAVVGDEKERLIATMLATIMYTRPRIQAENKSGAS